MPLWPKPSKSKKNALRVEEAPQHHGQTRYACRWRLCGRWRGHEGGCCWADDGRPLGNLTNFILGLVYGSVAPIFSLITVYGFESSKLTRTGTIFGNANFFLLLAASIVAYVTHSNPTCGLQKVHAVAPLVVGLIFLLAAHKSLKWFLWVYRTRQNKTESEDVKVVSKPGWCCAFVTAFLASLFFSIIGVIAVLIVRRRYLRSRFGAFVGFGFGLVVAGTTLAFYGVPPILLAIGLFLIQISAAHFKRAIVSATALEEKNNSSC